MYLRTDIVSCLCAMHFKLGLNDMDKMSYFDIHTRYLDITPHNTKECGKCSFIDENSLPFININIKSCLLQCGML